MSNKDDSEFDLRFEWDVDKAHRNLSKHGASFEEAAAALDFDQSRAIKPDNRFPYEEPRFRAVSRHPGGRLLSVTITFREDVVRIINARLSDAQERRQYEENERRD